MRKFYRRANQRRYIPPAFLWNSSLLWPPAFKNLRRVTSEAAYFVGGFRSNPLKMKNQINNLIGLLFPLSNLKMKGVLTLLALYEESIVFFWLNIIWESRVNTPSDGRLPSSGWLNRFSHQGLLYEVSNWQVIKSAHAIRSKQPNQMSKGGQRSCPPYTFNVLQVIVVYLFMPNF